MTYTTICFQLLSTLCILFVAHCDDILEDWPWVGVFELPRDEWCYECGGCITFVDIQPGSAPNEYRIDIEFMELVEDEFVGPYTMFILNWPETGGEIVSGGEVPGWILRFDAELDLLEVEVRSMLFDVDAICDTTLSRHTDWPLEGHFAITEMEWSKSYSDCGGMVTWVDITPQKDPYHYNIHIEIHGNSGNGWDGPHVVTLTNYKEVKGVVSSENDNWSFHEEKTLIFETSASMFGYQLCDSHLTRFETMCDYEFMGNCAREVEACVKRDRCEIAYDYFQQPGSNCGTSMECWIGAQLPETHPDFSLFDTVISCRDSLDACQRGYIPIDRRDAVKSSTTSPMLILGGVGCVLVAFGGIGFFWRRRKRFSYEEIDSRDDTPAGEEAQLLLLTKTTDRSSKCSGNGVGALISDSGRNVIAQGETQRLLTGQLS